MRVIDEWSQRWDIAGHPCVDELKQLLGEQSKLTPDSVGKTEQDVQSLIRIKASELGNSMMRNNNGVMVDPETKRHVRFGLGNDSKRLNDIRKSSDLIGLTSIVVQPHHVGRTLAVFTAIEVKEPGWKKPRLGNEREQAQLNFISYIRSHGGVAGFATSVQDYLNIVGEQT